MTAAKIDQSAMTPEQLELIAKGLGNVHIEAEGVAFAVHFDDSDDPLGCLWSLQYLSAKCEDAAISAGETVNASRDPQAGALARIGTTLRVGSTIAEAICITFADWQKGRAG